MIHATLQDTPAHTIYAPADAEFQSCNRLFQGIPSLERTPSAACSPASTAASWRKRPGTTPFWPSAKTAA